VGTASALILYSFERLYVERLCDTVLRPTDTVDTPSNRCLISGSGPSTLSSTSPPPTTDIEEREP